MRKSSTPASQRARHQDYDNHAQHVADTSFYAPLFNPLKTRDTCDIHTHVTTITDDQLQALLFRRTPTQWQGNVFVNSRIIEGFSHTPNAVVHYLLKIPTGLGLLKCFSVFLHKRLVWDIFNLIIIQLFTPPIEKSQHQFSIIN